MYVVLCDVCKENTNRDHPVGTVTRTFTTKGGERRLKSQEFSSNILNVELGNDDQERMHVCSPCFTKGLVESTKALPTPEK